MNSWKALFAKDRWEILRLGYWQVREVPYITIFQLRNRYNGKTRSTEREGYFRLSDFPNNTFR